MSTLSPYVTTCTGQGLTDVTEVRKQGRVSLGSSVTVKATPANNRFRDVFATKLESVDDALLTNAEEVIPPSSIASMVPSTGLRKGYTDAYPNGTSPLDAIGGTPTKRTAESGFLRRPNLEEDVIPPSPSMDRRNISAQQLFVPGSITKEQRRLSFTSPSDEQLFATPIKAKPRALNQAQNAQEKSLEEKKSIYERLGWDDEFDDL